MNRSDQYVLPAADQKSRRQGHTERQGPSLATGLAARQRLGAALIVALLSVAWPARAKAAAAPNVGGASSVTVESAADHPTARAAAELLHARRERAWPLLRRWLAGEAIRAEPTQTPALPRPQLIKLGASLYGMYCQNCHGPSGRGDGPRAAVFDPRPRDFRSGLFKFRSTPTGSPPTEEDLFRTISAGLRGTGMLPFADLPEIQRWALAAYVRSLVPNQSELSAAPLSVPAPPEDLSSEDRIRTGKDRYRQLGCNKCHGESGRGDGTAAPTLVDAWGRSAAPRDLVAQPLKRGDRPEDVFRSLATGLDGSPMPSYRDAAGDSELWDLVAFVESLQQRAARGVSPSDLARARARVAAQQRQGAHTVIGGCGCQAGGKQ